MRADAAAGKRTLIVRLGPQKARWGYALLTAVAYVWLMVAILAGALPVVCTVALLPAALSFKAGQQLLQHAQEPARLTPAIQATIAAANVNGLLLALALGLARWF